MFLKAQCDDSSDCAVTQTDFCLCRAQHVLELWLTHFQFQQYAVIFLHAGLKMQSLLIYTFIIQGIAADGSRASVSPKYCRQSQTPDSVPVSNSGSPVGATMTMPTSYSKFETHTRKTCLYNVDPLKPHFYTVNLGFTGVYVIVLISAQLHKLWVLVRTASPRGPNDYLQSMF